MNGIHANEILVHTKRFSDVVCVEQRREIWLSVWN